MESVADMWLLLTQYSQKYGVSVSTLRRRIRTSKVEYRLVEGKYYVKDVPPPGMLPRSAMFSESEVGNLSDVLTFCKDLIQSKEKMYQEILADKLREITALKERIAEQKMLIQILEDKMAQRNSTPKSLDH